MYEFGFITGALTMMLLSFLSNYSYKSTLVMKAKRGESEKILKTWVRLELEENK